jgi:hypothetical protein
MFHSTRRREPPGVGEKGFEEWFTKRFGNLTIGLIIFDEAQRMTEEVIKNSPRGKVDVYFYDDSQVLVGNETGTRDNFLTAVMGFLVRCRLEVKAISNN